MTGGRFLALGGGRAGLRLDRTYDTDAEDLWACWTEPERLARWLGTLEGERREGADLVLRPATAPAVAIRVLHCAAPDRLVVRWDAARAVGAAAGTDDADARASLVDLRLEPLGGGRTRLRLEHLLVDDDAVRRDGAGWPAALARLDLATGGDPTRRVRPSPPSGTDDGASARAPYDLPVVERRADGPGRLLARRWVSAEPAAVWACLAGADGLRRWYAEEVELDPQVGGRLRCVFDQGAATGEVLACRPGREVSVSWRWDGSDTTSRMTLTLEPLVEDGRTGTLVTWVEDGAAGYLEGLAAGLAAHLGGLDRAARGLGSTDSRWSADFVLALSAAAGRYRNPFG